MRCLLNMKHYVIIGAGSGIGYTLAQELSREHKVTTLGRRTEAPDGLTVSAHYMCNVEDEHPAFPTLNEPIHGLIYCPGSINLRPFRSLKPEDFTAEWNLSVLGAVKSIKHFLPGLQLSQGAHIILFSTVAVQTGMAFHASISAAKGAIEGLTRSLAAELAPGIRVNAVAPSITQTPLADKLLNTESKLTAAKERHPLKSIGSPEEISKAVLYLLDSSWVTGQVITVDGGISTLR